MKKITYEKKMASEMAIMKNGIFELP